MFGTSTPQRSLQYGRQVYGATRCDPQAMNLQQKIEKIKLNSPQEIKRVILAAKQRKAPRTSRNAENDQNSTLRPPKEGKKLAPWGCFLGSREPIYGKQFP